MHDSSSHIDFAGPMLWTRPWVTHTHGLGPTNPRVMIINLHTTHDEFNSFPKSYGTRRIRHQALDNYFSEVGSISHVKYFQQLQ